MSGEKDWATQQAEQAIDRWDTPECTETIVEVVAAALRSERARWTAFAGADGEPRRVLGTERTGHGLTITVE